MITLMTGAWSNIPKTWDSVETYVKENQTSIEKEVNEFINTELKNKPQFSLGKEEIAYISNYVELHKSDINYAYPVGEYTFYDYRFNCMITDAIDDLLKIRGYYKR